MKFLIKDFFSKCDQIRRKLHGNKSLALELRAISKLILKS